MPTFVAIAPAAGYLSQLLLAPGVRLRLGTARQAAEAYAHGGRRSARRLPAGYTTNVSA
ncbi:MAG TPA: hypothetical protein GYA10_15825 [Alphaproteobacteria bacterium]|nr:hypothetical protein [Alphaproteobacteria bacterium]